MNNFLLDCLTKSKEKMPCHLCFLGSKKITLYSLFSFLDPRDVYLHIHCSCSISSFQYIKSCPNVYLQKLDQKTNYLLNSGSYYIPSIHMFMYSNKKNSAESLSVAIIDI
jgi:hypothetical protein